jgi:hypothetical protein
LGPTRSRRTTTPKGFDPRLSIASLPAQGVCVLKYHAFCRRYFFLTVSHRLHFFISPSFLPAILAVQVPSPHSGSDSRSTIRRSQFPDGSAIDHPFFKPTKKYFDWTRNLPIIIFALRILPSQPRRQPRSLGHPLTIVQTGIATSPHRAYSNNSNNYISTFT